MEPTTILLKLAISCIAFSPVIAYFIITEMANNKKGAVRDKEGHIYAIEKGEQNIGFITAIDGWHLNDPNAPGYDSRYPKGQLLPNTWGAPDDLDNDWLRNKNFSKYTRYDRCICRTQDDVSRMQKRHRDDPYYENKISDTMKYFTSNYSLVKDLLGITILGVPWVYSVRVFKNFSWNKWITDEKHPGGLIQERNEDVDSMIFQYQYPFTISLMSGDKKENKSEMVQFEITVLATVQMFLPYNTLYNIKNWIGYLNSEVDGKVRDWASQQTIEELQEGNHNNAASSFLASIGTLNEPDALPKFGLRITDAVFQDIKIKSEKVREAIDDAYASLRRKEAKENEAEGEQAMIKAVLQEAQGKEERNKAWEVLKMKEIAKSNLQVFNTGGGNTGTVVSLKEKKSNEGGKNV